MAEGNDRDSMEEDLPPDIKLWTKDQVRKWVHNLDGDEERVAEKLFEEDVDGSSLLLLNSQDFKGIGVKLGPAKRIIQAKDEWLKEHPSQSVSHCVPYPFGTYHNADRYIENNVLQIMESGSLNLIEPCHEFKAFTQTTDETKMKKFTDETIRFAAACMNSRTNGTIHFGIGDTKQGFKHGQVLGVDVEDKEDYANNLQRAIEAYFEHKYVKDAKKCIKHPRFVGVLSRNMTSSTKYVIEVDIVPDSLICKENYYHTNTHDVTTKKARKKINGTENSQPSKQFFVREGGSTVNLLTQTPEDKKEKRYQSVLNGMSKVSELRKGAEDDQRSKVRSSTQGALLADLITGGSLSMDTSHVEHYVIVTNKSHPNHLESLAFLVDLDPVAVLDFDPESARSGLQDHLNQSILVNVHFPEKYKITEKVEDMAKRLNLTRNTSWIFCNGGTDQETPSEIDQWLMEKGASVRDVISFLCRPDVLPRNRFLVIFLLLSTVNDKMDPIVETFCNFSQELRGTQQILCISDNKSGFTSWKNLIEARNNIDISPRCIYELSFAEVNGTILNLWSEKQRSLRFLPCGGGSTVVLGKKEEQSMSTLEVLCTNECEGENKDIILLEENFYRGGDVTWWNFYVSEQPGSSQFIKRDMLDHILNHVVPGLRSLNKACVVLNLKHLPGCGGTTLAMHTLWSLKDQCRCAVLRENQADQSEIAKQVVKLLTYERKEDQPTVPVLLMIDDFEDEDKVSDLQELIETECEERGIQSSSALVLLLNCRRSESSHSIQSSPDTVFIGHYLSPNEKKRFEAKLREIKKTHKNADTFYGFMIMKENFQPEYIQSVVKATLKRFDKKHKADQLFAILVLLNVYGRNASLSVSHCEDFLDIQTKPFCGKNKIQDEFGKLSPLLGHCLVEGKVKFSAIKVIHYRIAEECLNELTSTHSMKRAEIVDILLNTDTVYGCTQGRDYLLQELRYILVNRQSSNEKKNKFSPFIEDIARETPGLEESVLENASKRFEKDAVVCQLLARYNYLRKKNFREARTWAEKARALHKDNSYMADTSAQVIKHELKNALGNFKDEGLVPERLEHCLKLAHEATEGFKETQRLAKKESVQRLKSKFNNTLHNTSGCLGEIEVDVLVIDILENIPVFSAHSVRHDIVRQVLAGKLKLQNIEANDPQKHRNKPFYDILKQYEGYLYCLKGRMRENFDFLDKININLSTQFGLKADSNQDLEKRLLSFFSQYRSIFCNTTTPELNLPKLLKARQFLEMEKADSYTGILNHLSEGKAVGKLEESAREYEYLCARNPTFKDCINSIYVSVVLSLTKRESRHVPPYQTLVDWLQKVLRNPISVKDSSSTYFIAVVLLWPSHLHPTKCESLEKYISLLRSCYHDDMKEVYCGKWPVLHFFLGKKHGYDRLVHLRQIKECFEYGPEEFVSMWRNGQIWKDEKVKELLLRVTGEIHRDVILADTGTLKLEVTPMSRSQTSGYWEGCKMSFFIGFTMKGPTALDIMPVPKTLGNNFYKPR